jgi:hypothetical protein
MKPRNRWLIGVTLYVLALLALYYVLTGNLSTQVHLLSGRDVYWGSILIGFGTEILLIVAGAWIAWCLYRLGQRIFRKSMSLRPLLIGLLMLPFFLGLFLFSLEPHHEHINSVRRGNAVYYWSAYSESPWCGHPERYYTLWECDPWGLMCTPSEYIVLSDHLDNWITSRELVPLQIAQNTQALFVTVPVEEGLLPIFLDTDRQDL